MGSEWQEVTIGEIASIKHGFAFKGEYFTDEPQSSVLLTPGNFAVGGGFQAGKPKYYLGPIPADYVLVEGDLVVTMTDLSKASDTLGYAARVPQNSGTTYLHNQRTGLVQVKDSQTVRPEWLHYLMRTQPYRSWVVGSASGTTVKHTSPSRIGAYAFRLPPVVEQIGVANTLDAIEARIDLLRQSNTTLEAIAQALFKSWFVDFDPVHAKAEGREPEVMGAATAALFPSEFEESELGLIPKGWRAVVLRETLEINPRYTLRKGTLAPYLDMASVPTSGHVPTSPVEREFSSGTKFKNGDTLLARITPCLENGKTAHVDSLEADQIGWGSTEFIVLRPRSPLTPYFAYLLARQPEFRAFAIQSMTGTSGRQRIELGQLERFRLTVPDDRVAVAFGSFIEPIRKAIAANANRMVTLSQLRDTLLPRLISGKLRLSGAEAAIEDPVA